MSKITAHIPDNPAITQEQLERVSKDPVYFVDEFGWTFDPRPQAYPHHLKFKLYDFQKDLLLDIIQRIKDGRSLMIEKSRDMGASWIALYAIMWCWLFLPGFQALVGSRTENKVDDGTLESLFGKLEYILKRLPVRPDGFVFDRDRTRLKIVNPNGNVIKGESANVDFGRQGRYRVVLLDEMAFWESPEQSWSSCGESTRCRIAITTPPQRQNFAKYLRFSGIIDVATLHWRLHPLKDEKWYQMMKSEKTPEELAREVDINWEGSITGRVYPEVDHIRFGTFHYRTDWPLYISHDPGHAPDPHALQWYQIDPESRRKRLIASFEASNKVAEWFLPMFGKPISSEYVYTPEELAFIDIVGKYKGAIHFGDQAGRTRNEVTGTSVYDEFKKYDIYVRSNTLANDLETRKRMARRILMDLDVNDTKENRYCVECWKDARYPDLNENSNRVTPNDKPIHDWTSHHRTCLEYFAVNLNPEQIRESEVRGATFFTALASVQSHQTDEYIIKG